MSKQKPTLEQMTSLIKEGISTEVLSKEFEIPIGELEEFKAKVIAEKNKKTVLDKAQQIKLLKNRYNLLYRVPTKSKSNSAEALLNKDEKLINKTITDAQEQMNNQQNCDIVFFADICSKFKTIMELNLTYEQAFQAYRLLNCEKMKQAKLDSQIAYSKKRIEGNIIIKISKSAKLRIEESEDIENLNRIKKDLASINAQYNMWLESAKDAANRKISNLQLANAKSHINDVKSEKLRNIIKNIADGTINIEEAKSIIKEEANQSMSMKKTTIFWNNSNEEESIILQLTNSLSKQAMLYPIQNPVETVEKLSQLGIDLNLTLTTVVKNLIERNEFKNANKLCERYENLAQESNTTNCYIRKLKKDILYAKASYFAKKLVQSENTTREAEFYFDALKQIINQEKIDLSEISLGTSVDGSLNITLASIWFLDEQKKKDVNNKIEKREIFK